MIYKNPDYHKEYYLKNKKEIQKKRKENYLKNIRRYPN